MTHGPFPSWYFWVFPSTVVVLGTACYGILFESCISTIITGKLPKDGTTGYGPRPTSRSEGPFTAGRCGDSSRRSSTRARKAFRRRPGGTRNQV